jgi:hypothetical protein
MPKSLMPRSATRSLPAAPRRFLCFLVLAARVELLGDGAETRPRARESAHGGIALGQLVFGAGLRIEAIALFEQRTRLRRVTRFELLDRGLEGQLGLRALRLSSGAGGARREQRERGDHRHAR